MIQTKESIEHLLQIVMKEAKNLDIPISNHIDPVVKINERAKSRFACCRQSKQMTGTKYEIEVSRIVFQCREHSMKEILAHEVLHTCRGCQNHGSLWKSYADRMNRKYGYQIKRVSAYEELGIRRERNSRTVRYKIVCQNCGLTFYRQKRSKLIKNIDQYRCRCGGRLICKTVNSDQIIWETN